MQNYINITCSLKEEFFDLVYSELEEFPFTGIEERYDEIIVTLPSELWNFENKKTLINAVRKYDENGSITSENSITDRNWNQEWEKNVKPVIINDRIVITPEWKKEEFNHEILLIINPKMSFGTGEHETTRLVCKLMEKNVKPGSFWIDAGTGTGVLAVLSVKLGAKRCFAFDNNSWSYENACENFELNGVSGFIDISEENIDKIELPKADGISANLFTHLILRSFNKFYESLKDSNGVLIVSGILIYDKDDIIKQADKSGFKLEEIIYEAEWVGFVFKAI
jgi:ribosomal protein L11 methyltransferase